MGVSVLRSVLLYSLSVGVVSAANFAATPLLLHLLGHDAFAQWSLIEPVLLALVPVAGLGIQVNLLRKISREAVADRSMVAGLLPFHLATSLVIGFIGGAIVIALGLPTLLALLALTTLAVEGTLIFFVALWRAEERPGRYALIEGGRAVALAAVLAIALCFVAAGSMTVDNYLAARLALAIVAALAALQIVRPDFRPASEAARQAIRYGLPIVVASMLGSILTSVDRYALGAGSADALAGYVAHTKVAQLLALASIAYFMWFGPKAMRKLDDGISAHRFFVVATTTLFLVILALCANTWFIVPLVWPYFFPTVAFDRELFGILLAGTAMLCLGNPLSLGALREGKTYLATLLSLAAVTMTLLACFALGGLFGPIGVAWGRMLGMATYSILFAVSTIMALRIRYPFALYALFAIGAALLVASEEAMLPGHGVGTTALKIVTFNALALVAVVACRGRLHLRTRNLA